jgi:hypothetical protein
MFPCFTIRTLDPFKKRGFFYTTKEYVEQSYSLIDIFDDETILSLKNSSLFLYKELHTLYHGNIIVICPVKKVGLKDRFYINLKKNTSYEIYVFPRGEELWFGLTRFPTYVSVITIDTDKMQSADLAISEKETQQLSKKGSPCQKYETESSSQVGFVECGREAIASFLKSRINCLIPGLSLFFSNPNEMPACQDEKSAKESYQFFRNFMLFAKPTDYGCPLPCTQTNYNLEIKYFHLTAYLDIDDTVMSFLCPFHYIFLYDNHLSKG